MTNREKQCLLCYVNCLEPWGIDGIWGEASAQATLAAQRKLGLKADGLWGPDTEAAIVDYVSGTRPEESWWQGIRHFTREEFRCRCGGQYCSGFPAEPSKVLAELADSIRERFGKPAIPTSGLRCREWNRLQGGVANSRHMSGKALDFYIPGVSAQALLAAAQADPRTRYAYIIDQGPAIHMDVD